MEIKVEVSQTMFSDKVKGLEDLSKTISMKMQSVLGVSSKITFVEPGSIERSEGKAKRVVDMRSLH